MRRCLNDHHPAAPFSDDNAGFVGTRSAHEGVSRLSVVPRGPYLRYLCAHMTDTSGMTRGISTTLLRVSGADEHRYAR